MDERRFDDALRALNTGATRRRGLPAALGLLVRGTALGAAAKSTGQRKPGKEGPCGDFSRKDNI